MKVVQNTPIKPPIKVGLVDDHDLIRETWAYLINKDEQKYTVTLSAANGKDMINQLASIGKKLIPDIMIVDINMPVMNGFLTVEWLKKMKPDVKIMILTMHSAPDMVVKMIKLGVDAYLTKNSPSAEIYAGLTALADNKSYYSPDITEKIIQSLKQGGSKSENLDYNQIIKIWYDLTEKEKEVVKLFCTELTYTEIANKSNISNRAIESYRVNLFDKFNVKTRVGMAVLAVKNRLIEL
jgi:two-component system, NarL family, invasion response regulator UvrY